MAKLTPYPWQIEDQRVLAANNYTGLVMIQAGGGKSLTATLAIRDAKPEVTLIVAPKSTHHTAWIPTLRDNADVEARVIGTGKKAEQEAYADFLLGFPGVYLVTPQWLTRTDVSEWRGDMMIIDESHQVTTKGSKAQRKISGSEVRDGEPLARRFGMRLALSGTPMRQAFENMWGTMRFLWPDLYERGQVAYDNFWGWQADRMVGQKVWTNQIDPRTGRKKQVMQWVGEAEPGRLVSEMPCVIIHKRRETCCEWHKPVQLADGTWTPGGFLPVEKPQVIPRRVELTSKQTKAIREMEAHMMTFLDDNQLAVDISLTQKQRIRQLTLGEAKVEYTENDKSTIEYDVDCKSPFIDEAIHILSNLPDDEAVLVFLESQRFAEVVTHRLTQAGYPAREYSGKTKADLTQFGKEYRVLVGVLSAIGTGTAGLNHVSSTEIVMEQPVSLTLKEQGEARLDRLDNKRQVQRYILLDDMGVQEGRFEQNIIKQALVNRSLQKVPA